MPMPSYSDVSQEPMSPEANAPAETSDVESILIGLDPQKILDFMKAKGYIAESVELEAPKDEGAAPEAGSEEIPPYEAMSQEA